MTPPTECYGTDELGVGVGHPTLISAVLSTSDIQEQLQQYEEKELIPENVKSITLEFAVTNPSKLSFTQLRIIFKIDLAGPQMNDELAPTVCGRFVGKHSICSYNTSENGLPSSQIAG